MSLIWSKVLAETELLRQQVAGLTAIATDYSVYRTDPCAYARDVLQVEWWAKQQEIAGLLLVPPYRVLVKSAHSVGKTHLAGGLVNWWYDSFQPSIVITTAPSDKQVKDLLWKEVKTQRGGRPGFTQIARMQDSPLHYALGTTARETAGFQGHHGEHVFGIIDEAVGVDPQFWDAMKSMCSGDGNALIAFFNPTATDSRAYLEEFSIDQDGQPLWHIVTMSGLDHPNVIEELQGRSPWKRAAIRLSYVEDLLQQWCIPVGVEEHVSTDVFWPPQGTPGRLGRWLRPGPIAEARLLGRWPSQGTYGVWSDAAWNAACTARLPEPDQSVLPQIGCDVARFGDDNTDIHVRRGPISLFHESVNGRDFPETAGRLKQLAREYAAKMNTNPSRRQITPEEISIKVDVDGIGHNVMAYREKFNFVGVSAAATASRPDLYPNRRSELWFHSAELAKKGKLDLSRLPPATRHMLRQQAMVPTWKVDAGGCCQVEKKEDTKEKLGRSPDAMDALNLAFYEGAVLLPPELPKPEPRRLEPGRQLAGRSGAFGR